MDKVIGIVGLGLIGGSMAKAIKAHTNNKVFAIDLKEETMQMAKMSGSIDGTLDEKRIGTCNIILIAIGPSSIVSWVKSNAKYFGKTTVLVDLCGIKRAIYDDISKAARDNGFLYIGGHPMAGKEVAGFLNADKDLWQGASMILTPDETADIITLDMLKEFFLSLGFGKLVFSTPEEHDRIISYTSQLAHVTSSAYIKSPTSMSQMGFSAGSYKDMTRVAKLDPDIWTELFIDNADNLSVELETLINNLTDYKVAIENRDHEKLHELLANGLKLKLAEEALR